MTLRPAACLIALTTACASRGGPTLDVSALADAAAFDRMTIDASLEDRAALEDVRFDAPRPDAVPGDAPPADVSIPDAGPGDAAALRCPTSFRYAIPAGRSVQRVEVTGEWNGWSNPGVALRREGDAFVGEVPLPVGTHGYKLLIDGAWSLDPAARRRKYVDGLENSAVRVPDCRVPTWVVERSEATRPGPDAGVYRATLRFVPGISGSPLDPDSIGHQRLSLTPTAPPIRVTPRPDGRVEVESTSLPDWKHTLRLTARDREGRDAAPLLLRYWIEPEPFEWRDTLLYLAMPDRFVNGDRANDPARASGVDPRADYQGGDLQGLRARINDGTFDRLGVRAIWITPVNTNPAGSFLAQDGVHQVTGYHGYWPVRARAVDPRLGGDLQLDALVADAHSHGIRVLLDFVVNHVHRDHEHALAHPEWFRTGCVCGTAGCDWTARRLDCLFTPYLPDVNWSVNAAAEQFVEDAAWWVDRFNLDGLRVDAVKHVEDIAAINLRATLSERAEASGLRVFLTGETAMGWNDCGLDCNRGEYDTISRYIGPTSLDGQKDFVLYHAVPYRVFATDDRGMLHADYWTRQSQEQYPAGALMTPYIGSHDTPRFVTLASYRGQSSQWDRGVPSRQWDNVAGAPGDAEPYARHRLAMAWLLTIPGVPLVYMGDEYGEWGGADPNNRRAWRGDASDLSAEERATLAHTRALGAARRELVALRRGRYETLAVTEDVLVFARRHEGATAVVALNRAGAERTVTARLPAGSGISDGTALRDRLGGPGATVTGGAINLRLSARGAMVLAP